MKIRMKGDDGGEEEQQERLNCAQDLPPHSLSLSMPCVSPGRSSVGLLSSSADH